MAADPAGADGDVEAAIDELFAGEPSEFVAGRNALAKRLRGEGRREAAGRLAGLRRPSAVAWALNQLVRRERGQVELLLRQDEEIRELLRSPQGAARQPRFRAAMEERRETVRNLASLAAAILAGGGNKPTPAATERIFGTLQAVATDAGVREAVRRGRLVEDARPGAFSEEAMPVWSTGAPADGGDEGRTSHTRERLEEARRAAAQRADEVEDLRRALRRLEHDAEEAERRARRARTEAERTAGAYQKAKQAAEVADQAVRDLEDG